LLVEKEIRNFKMFLDTDDEGMSTNLINSGSWEGDAPDIMARLVKPGWNVIEMGACIGFYAMIEAKNGANVFIIEPDPDNIDIINKNIKLNHFNKAKTFRMAISDTDGYAFFRTSPGRSDRGRLSEKGEIEVKTVTLDTFVDNIDIESVHLLRFDIEGAEVGLVAGGQNTLSNMKVGSWIFADIHPTKVKNPLGDLKQALDSILSHGFVPKKVLAPERYSNLSLDVFAEAICKFKGFPKIFFRKE